MNVQNKEQQKINAYEYYIYKVHEVGANAENELEKLNDKIADIDNS